MCILTLETLVHVIGKRWNACCCAIERCPALDNVALFQMKGHSVIVIIMTPGKAFALTKLFYLNLGLSLKSTHLVKSPESRVNYRTLSSL